MNFAEMNLLISTCLQNETNNNTIIVQYLQKKEKKDIYIGLFADIWLQGRLAATHTGSHA